MARLIHYKRDSPPLSSSNSPAFRSCQSLTGSDSPLFHSPRSSPDPFPIRHDSDDLAELEVAPTETTPLMITEENHFGTYNQNEVSMSLTFSGNQGSSSNDIKTNSCWRKTRKGFVTAKPFIFFIFALVFSAFFASKSEVSETAKLMCISHSVPEYIVLENTPHCNGIIRIEMSGPFPDEYEGYDKTDKNLTIGLIGENGTIIVNSETAIPILLNSSSNETHFVPVKRTLRLNLSDGITHIMLSLTSNTSFPVAVSLNYYLESATFDTQVIVAFIILVGVYILIIFELVHRAVAAMLGSLAALSFLSHINKRPSLETILTWVEWETLALLFGMMTLVAVFAKTGFFDYVALKAYKMSKGHVWGLITLLCACTAFISALLDNVTVILLLTPVTIRLCQVLNLNPTYVLIAEVIFSNIGGTATAIGDPPNVIIVSNKDVKQAGIDFANFTGHLTIGIIFCLVVAYATLRLLYWKVKIVNDDPPIIEELKREAEIWKRTADRVPLVSAEEKTVKVLLLQKYMIIENTIRKMKRTTSRQEAFQNNLQELERKYVIKDPVLLMKSAAVIVLVVVLFFVQSFVEELDLQVGWIAVLGAILLILLADIEKMEELMEQVEWTTLVFFAGLFILMESLSELGLMEFLSNKTSTFIQSVDEEKRLRVALIAIIWISALVSSFVDNIPFTTAMIPVVIELHKKAALPQQPLVWALAMGSCLGGNGTLIGASANVVCAGLAEQYGYPISFNKFFRVGFPIMLVTTTAAMGYLLIAHTVFDWGNK